MTIQPPAQLFHPATFAERGVAIPLTTPLLQGSRARTNGRQRLELIVPNPAGARGVYVLPWTGWGELCQPTLHDAQLHSLLSQGTGLSPRSVRVAARAVAIEGAAGRPARAAALLAQQAEAHSLQEINRHLLAMFIAESGGAAQAGELSALAAVLHAVGLGEWSGRADLPLRVCRLRSFRDGLEAWSATHDDDTGRLAKALYPLADVAIRSACVLLERVRAGSVHDLLTAHRQCPGAMSAMVARPEWILDGWDLPCSLWQEAESHAGQRPALVEIAAVAPVLPREAEEWLPGMTGQGEDSVLRRLTALNQQWTTGLTTTDLVARNEQLLALAA